MGLLAGKTALIFGIANDHSIAWGIAKAFHQEGATLGFSYAGPVIEKRIRPLADSLGVTFVEPCDVSKDEEIVSVAEKAAKSYGQIDILVHSIGFASQEELAGPYFNTSRAGFHLAMDISVYSFSALAKAFQPIIKPGGSLRIWAGSIGVHAFDLEFLKKMAGKAGILKFHCSKDKKASHVDCNGREVRPAKGNAIKFERFIFDLLPEAEGAILVEVDRRGHFAPLKNASDAEEKEDTPETVKAQMIALHSEWLRQARAEVDEGVPVEISPLFALDAEELKGKIKPGTRLTKPTCFS